MRQKQKLNVQLRAPRRAPCAGLSGPCTLRNNLENNPDAKYLPDLPTMTLKLALARSGSRAPSAGNAPLRSQPHKPEPATARRRTTRHTHDCTVAHLYLHTLRAITARTATREKPRLYGSGPQ